MDNNKRKMVVELLKQNKSINSIAKSLKLKKKEILSIAEKENITKEIVVEKEVLQTEDKGITEYEPKKRNDVANKDLLELLEVKDILLQLVAEHKRKDNIIDIPLLQCRNVTDVKATTVKADREILENWNNFCKEHKEFKVQQLISLALEEFIEKYKNRGNF